MSLRALSRRVKRMEDAGKPRPSPFAAIYGTFDLWVERDVLPGLESGALDRDFIDVIAALRGWETDGTWEQAHAR